MSTAQRIFLDTTIQIERVTATRARQIEIERALAGVQVLTSTYVLGEYLRTLVQDALVLYNLVDLGVNRYRNYLPYPLEWL